MTNITANNNLPRRRLMHAFFQELFSLAVGHTISFVLITWFIIGLQPLGAI